MSAIGVAVAGTGFIGPVHVEALRRLGDVRVKGVLGSSPAKSERVRQATYHLKLSGEQWQLLGSSAREVALAYEIEDPVERLRAYRSAREALDDLAFEFCGVPSAIRELVVSELVRSA